MFGEARRRLTLTYIAMFALVLTVFSVSFLAFISIALEPNFDVTPDTTSDQAAQQAYDAAVERIGLALGGADIVAIVIVGVGAWLLAARTLGPIREAHERQRRFVADASHEMRTPLTAIRATTDNALRATSAPDEQRAALATIKSASAELASLTADLLTLAQSDDARSSKTAQRFDLSVVVAERLALRIASGLPVPRTILATDLVVEGSADEVGRVIDNLVDNAYRYGGPSVQVQVGTRTSDRHAVLEVSDDGPGIAEADQQRIFEPFFRVRADSSAPAGSGLGLAIASALTRRNRGRLTLTSQPGQGSTFRLSLPLAS